jgi:purine-nucleoside phosphorylase
MILSVFKTRQPAPQGGRRVPTDRRKRFATYPLQVQEAADFVAARLDAAPRLGLMTGTGLGGVTADMTVATELLYSEIPHFPAPTVQSHHGRLLCGTLAGTPALALQGRFHLYEGYTPLAVAFPVRVLQALGVDILLVTNAAGGLNPSFGPGDLMVITDHINLTGENPLVGPNLDRWGLRFPDMTRVYDPVLAATAQKAAAAAGIPLTRGVYAGLKGPSLETPAEIRLLKTIGADAVGMSTVQEVIAAVHGGMRVFGVSIITNLNDPDHPVPATVEAIVAVAEKAAPQLGRIVSGIAAELSGV